ncbi:MAG: NAD(P)-dependent alcohol dehydrogenase [Candidatus Hydrogenedentes bacterium]|nr:NAD(P)-dependent alcohol dehydrogenase [Candidatus Hydrogenedentota bacterium]
MKVLELHGDFGFDSLRIAERPDPVPGPGEVLVQVRAASLNYRDLLTIQGIYNPRQPLPLIPASDGAGVVVGVGPGVTRVSIGDRVAAIFAQGWLSGPPNREKLASTTLGGPLDGMLAELAVFREDGLVHIPGHLTDEEAATLPCAAVTAWSALVRHGSVKAGDRVLVMGTGGVSVFALQFARLLGAEVIVISSSDAKLERAKALGAAHGINYKQHPAWSKLVRELTGGEGVDHVIEVGGVGTLPQSMRTVRMGGHISLIGVLGGVEAPLNLTPILMQDIRLQGVIVGPRDAFLEMNRAIGLHALHPVVDRVFPFGETVDAMRHLASASHFGKLCIQMREQ